MSNMLFSLISYQLIVSRWISFFFKWRLYCELNFHDQKIWRTLTHGIRKHWTAVSTLLDLISSVYRDLGSAIYGRCWSLVYLLSSIGEKCGQVVCCISFHWNYYCIIHNLKYVFFCLMFCLTKDAQYGFSLDAHNHHHHIALVARIRTIRVFANGPGDLGSIPGRVIPKTLKMVLDTSLLNTQQYKVRIKSKVEQSREKSSVLPYTSVKREPSSRPRLRSPTLLLLSISK